MLSSFLCYWVPADLWPTVREWFDCDIKDVAWCCYPGCVSILLSAVQLSNALRTSMCPVNSTCGGCSECNLLRKIRVLEDENSSLEQNVVVSYVQTSLVFSFLRFQLKIKSFQGLFFFSHSSPELQHLLKGFALAPHSWWELRDVSTSAQQRVRVRAASAVCRNTGHSISLLLQMHLLLPKHGFSQMRSLLRQERPAGNIFQGSRSICAAPKHQRSSPSNFQWNSLSKNKTWAWTVSQR